MNEQEIKIQQLEKRVADLEKQVAAATATSVDEIVAKAERVFLKSSNYSLSRLFKLSGGTIVRCKKIIDSNKQLNFPTDYQTVIKFLKITNSLSEKQINSLNTIISRKVI